MRKKQDIKEQLLNSLSGIGIVLLSCVSFLLVLFLITIAVRTFFALGAL